MTLTSTPIKTAAQVRQEFIDFFSQRAAHTFVPSSSVAPLHDPTLLFTNAGMNQFKPIFLGQVEPNSPLANLKRAVNTQKCIRAGGKHNDLDDVGKDGYHHTFFEMLGNWSFGDYFKGEAIQWAWELLTDIWGLDPERLYATYFEGKKDVGLDPDREVYDLWLKYLPAQRILPGNMKDNFWEMGDTGPCGPCSELHYDGRPAEERARVPGHELVNRESPDLIEIWNLVFIQFNRTESGLHALPAKHVDTGMGLERIVRVIQGKTSNYDTDVFTPLFDAIEEVCAVDPYGGAFDNPIDTAYRVIADHVRTLTFAISDGADPSNEGRGYVLRRILRRAVRYGRQTLGVEHPFLYELVSTVVETMQHAFPELTAHPQRIIDVVKDEEESFGKTLDLGIRFWWSAAGRALQQTIKSHPEAKKLDLTMKSRPTAQETHEGAIYYDTEIHLTRNGDAPTDVWRGRWDEVDFADSRLSFLGPVTIAADDAFKLHDTFGFPIDLTQLMAQERGLSVDVEGFERLMDQARGRSRSGGKDIESQSLALSTGAVSDLARLGIKPTDDSDKFHGRKIRAEVKTIWNGTDFDENLVASHTRPTDRFAVICDRTNHYAEMGGQVGDAGRMVVTRERKGGGNIAGGGEYIVEDTLETAGYVLHIGRITKGEIRTGDEVELRLDAKRRAQIASNHTSTHLLNLALRDLLGDHIDQKGSLVAPDRLRFDFSHGHAVGPEQIAAIEHEVNGIIHKNLPVNSKLVSLEEGQRLAGLRAVFGETYPDPVRVVTIGPTVDELLADPRNERWLNVSTEFCGGTHLDLTGEAEGFIVIAEEGVAKGIRRIVAQTGEAARQALALADRLDSRLDGAAGLEDKYLAAEVADLVQEIESGIVPMVRRVALRERLAALQERVKSLKKQEAGVERDRAVEAARSLALEAKGDVIVGFIPAGSDRGALLAALDTVRARRSGAAILLLSSDVGEEKVTIVANVAQPMIARGLKAGDWVRAVSQEVGGKGGGRPDAAQGGGTQPEKVASAIELARHVADAAFKKG